MIPDAAAQKQTKPVLLFDDECGVCRSIARWVKASAKLKSGETTIVERPIGNDPEELRALNPNLDIWAAYATIHLLMPDGSLKVGGEAVAEVLRNLRNTRWFAWSFATHIFGFRPFQAVLNWAYAVLAEVRPLFGCDSCGTPGRWVRAIRWMTELPKVILGRSRQPRAIPHFTPVAMIGHRQ